MLPMLVIARLTVQESSRRRLLLALLILTLIVVGVSAWGFNKITTVTRSDGTPLPPEQVSLITSQLLIVVTFMFSGVLALSAAVVAGPLISGEVESGLLLSMLARPLRRSEVVIGKWLGLAAVSSWLPWTGRPGICRRIRPSSSCSSRPRVWSCFHWACCCRPDSPASPRG